MAAGRFLDYWAKNMCFTLAMTQGAQWPGFRYSDDERALMRERAASVSRGRFVAFTAWTTFLFIAAAGLLVGFGLVPLLSWFWPDASRLPAAGFFGVLAAAIALSPAAIVLEALLDGALVGLNLCRELRRRLPRTPVIVLSRLDEQLDADALRRQDHDRGWIAADLYLQKPVAAAMVAEQVEPVLHGGH
jgi:CheY-like chemotaxis protein